MDGRIPYQSVAFVFISTQLKALLDSGFSWAHNPLQFWVRESLFSPCDSPARNTRTPIRSRCPLARKEIPCPIF